MARGESADAPKAARILIVDDHPMMRRGLRDTLEGQADLVAAEEADSVHAAMKLLSESDYDLVVLDISFESGSNGLEFIKEIRARDTETKILVFSLHDESLYAERALRAGAQGYLEKSASLDEVLDAIRRVLRGELHLSPRMSGILLRRAVGQSPANASLPWHNLSDRELEVLEHIGRGLTTRQIAENLCLSEKTIETHRQNIKTKLGIESGTQLIRHAVRWMEQRQGDTSA